MFVTLIFKLHIEIVASSPLDDVNGALKPISAECRVDICSIPAYRFTPFIYMNMTRKVQI
jgi:hypothetical protein